MFRKKSESMQSPTQTSTQSGTGFTNDLQGNANLLDMFSTSKRRFNEKLGQMMGKETTHNGDFEQRRIETSQLYAKVAKLRSTMKSTLDASRIISQRSVDLSNVCGELDTRDDEFIKIQIKLEVEQRSILETSIGNALESLDKKIEAFKVLEDRIKERNNLKLDYDHYVRKVRELREKPGIDSSKVSNNETKLEAARVSLHNATHLVYKSFNYYSTVGGRIIAPEIEIFKNAQYNYFRASFQCVEPTKRRDPAEVYDEIERLGESGANIPITTGYEGTFAESTRLLMERSPSYAAPLHTDNSTKTVDSNDSSSVAPWNKSAGMSTKGAWWEQPSAMNPPPPPPIAQGSPARGMRAEAMYDYTAADGTEISFKVKDVIEVVKKDDSGWWVGKIGGYQGLFPANYVKML